MNLTVIEQPPFEPVSLADVYLHMRLDTDGSPPTHPDDLLLSSQITAARIVCEHSQQRSYMQQTLRLSFSGADLRHGSGSRYRTASNTYGPAWSLSGGWPCGRNWIELPRPPFGWVNHVAYYDGEGLLNLVDPADYYVTDDYVPRLRLANSFSFPAGSDNRDDAIRVEYVTGYLPTSSPVDGQSEYAENIPANIKAAILLGVQLLYDQPTDALGDSLLETQQRLLGVQEIVGMA